VTLQREFVITTIIVCNVVVVENIVQYVEAKVRQSHENLHTVVRFYPTVVRDDRYCSI
jgi:hypothetical protein